MPRIIVCGNCFNPDGTLVKIDSMYLHEPGKCRMVNMHNKIAIFRHHPCFCNPWLNLGLEINMEEVFNGLS